LVAGGVLVLHERFDAGEVLAAIENQRVTFLWLLPSLLHQLLDHPAPESTDTSSLRLLALGGWASTPHRVVQAIERFGPILGQGYGANEIGPVTWLTPEEHQRPELLTTVGRPVPGVEVSIRDCRGERVDTGVVGEIWARGPDLMTGYYQQPEETAKVLRDGWFRSGDLGFLGVEGYLSLVSTLPWCSASRRTTTTSVCVPRLFPPQRVSCPRTTSFAGCGRNVVACTNQTSC
jgi:fatty-acyl-CoA synthase